MGRLLTDKEIIVLVKAIPTESELALAFIARREQDVKTLKAVGEWLESKMFAVPLCGVEWHIRLDHIEALKRGEMPNENLDL